MGALVAAPFFFQTTCPEDVSNARDVPLKQVTYTRSPDTTGAEITSVGISSSQRCLPVFRSTANKALPWCAVFSGEAVFWCFGLRWPAGYQMNSFPFEIAGWLISGSPSHSCQT